MTQMERRVTKNDATCIFYFLPAILGRKNTYVFVLEYAHEDEAATHTSGRPSSCCLWSAPRCPSLGAAHDGLQSRSSTQSVRRG